MAENGDASLDNIEKESNYVLDPDQELLRNVHEILKLQNEQKKFNEEVLEKIRSAETKINKQSEDQQKMMIAIDEMQTKTDKLFEEHQEMKMSIGNSKLDDADTKPENEPKPIDNATSSDKIATPPAILPASGKSFVLKHVFKNILNMAENQELFSEEEEYFGVPWKMAVHRNEERLAFFLYCMKPTGKWSIDLECDVKAVSIESKTHVKSFDTIFGTHVSWGVREFIEWDKLKEDFVNDGKLRVEAHVKINKMTGIYKENLRNFDESMKMFSDVVLAVNGVKFYVSKLYLAAHSPYFQSLFLGHFQESKKSEINLSGIDSDDFQNYLEVLYHEGAIDDSTVEGLLLVADMYDTPIVIKKCEEYLMEKSKKRLKKKLMLSTRYDLEQLKKKCVSEIKYSSEFRSILTIDFRDMDHSLTRALLEKSLEFNQ